MRRSLFSRLPFRALLLVVFWLVLLVPLSLISVLSYSFLSGGMRDSNIQAAKNTLSLMAAGMSERVNNIDRVMGELTSDARIQSMTRKRFSALERYSFVTGYLAPRLQAPLLTAGIDQRIYLYLDQPELFEIYYAESEGCSPTARVYRNPLDMGRRFEIYRYDRLRDNAWSSDMQREPSGRIWLQVGDDALFDNISALYPLLDLERFQHVGLMRISMRRSDLFREVTTDAFAYPILLTVKDAAGAVLFTAETVDGDFSGQLETFTQSVSHGMMTLRAEIPVGALNEATSHVAAIIMWVAVGAAAVLMWLSYWFSNYLVRSVHNITGTIACIQAGDTGARIQVSSVDEFAAIGAAINNMQDYNAQLLKSERRAQEERRSAELMMLQAQINPHFLYNMLSTIAQLARVGDTDMVLRISMQLASFYRLTLSTADRICTVKQEIEQVMHYVNILKIKHQERLFVTTSFEPAILPCRTLRFILQPFVENAITHGWSHGILRIDLFGRAVGGVVEFEVRDNGVGMTEEAIHAALDINTARKRYGVYNVHQRIRLQYGDQYGVTIESYPGEGTRVIIRFPALDNEEA